MPIALKNDDRERKIGHTADDLWEEEALKVQGFDVLRKME